METATIDDLRETDLLGRGYIGLGVSAAICKHELHHRLNQMDLDGLEFGIKFLESAQRGMTELENPSEYCASIVDCYNYRDLREILIRGGCMNPNASPDFQRYIQVIRAIKRGQTINLSDATTVEEIFKELAYSAIRKLDELEE